MKRTLLLGGPGAGKTYRLIQIAKAAIRRGVPPDRIALVTFTNAAADEARVRACQELGLEPKQLPHFRTTHSWAFRQMGLRRGDVLSDENLAELSDITGELCPEDGPFASEGPASGMNADPLLTIDHYARTTGKTLEEAHHDHGGDVEWFRLKRFSEAYRIYKEDRGLIDFTDMLALYADSSIPPPPIELAIVDEGQDLSPLQRRAIRKAFAGVDELWEAGDDDQSIHRWAGADEEAFLSLPYQREVLPLARRLPRAVFELSREIVKRISRRYDKETRPSEREGHVGWLNEPTDVDLSSGTWLLMARTRAQLPELAAVARGQGVVYSVKGRPSVDGDHVRAIAAHERLRSGKAVDDEEARLARRLGDGTTAIWHDALIGIPLETREYYLACLRRGEDLRAEPRVRVETFHGAKGAEADGVLMLTDMTYRTQRGYEIDPDSETRVFYVGVTRARENLWIVEPRTPYGFRI